MSATNPLDHGFPVKRPGFIQQASWIGDDDDLSLQVTYYKIGGQGATESFETKNADPRAGEICLPTSSDISTIADNESRRRDILAAHLRMACFLHGLAVPGSREFEDSFVHLEGNHFQTSIGTVKVDSFEVIDDQCMNITFQKGSGPKETYVFDHQELNKYVFSPTAQVLVLPGAIEKEFSGYVHDHPDTTLTQAQKDNIVDFCLNGFIPWV